MTCVVSAISIVRAKGFTPDFLAIWPSAWMIAWVIAYPVLLAILPLVRRIVGMLVEA